MPNGSTQLTPAHPTGSLPAEEAAQILDGIVALSSEGVISLDEAQRITLFNHAAEKIFGYAAAEVLGRPLDVLLPERFVQRHRSVHLPAFGASGTTARGMRERCEVVGRRKGGAEFPVEVGIARTTTGGRVRYTAILRDVTERRRMEAELRERERRFHGIFDSAFEFVGLLSPDGTVLEANRTALDFIGARAEEVIGRPFWDTPWWRRPDDVRRLQEAVAAAAGGAFVRFETEHVGAGGGTITVDFSLKPVRDADGRVTLLIPEGRDVTEARRTEARLHESEETFRRAFEESGIGMALVGLDGSWQRVNRALCKLVGYSAEELLGLTFQDITHPEDLDTDLALAGELLAGERESYQLEKRYVRKDGSVVWILLDGTLVRGDAGEPRFFIAQIQDVTARRESEAALARQAAELARSNAELEQFAYVASHDLQEPLRAVASFTELLADRYADRLDERAQGWARYAVDGARQMQALISDLLALSRVGSRARPFAPTDLNVVLAETLRALAPVIRESGAEIVAAPLPTVEGDASQLGQLLQNLLGNAIKFRHPDTPPHVRLSVQADDHEWMVSVRDNGIGVDPRFADRVFVIFKRLHTREEYPGTGIGLAICKKIVERHGGRIWVEPATGGGADFRFTLPRTPVAAATGQEDA